jgi:hypothetical protein
MVKVSVINFHENPGALYFRKRVHRLIKKRIQLPISMAGPEMDEGGS